MELNFDTSIVANYHSGSQIARIVTEKWFADNMFCPRCGRKSITQFPNNKPVADFYCPDCKNQFEVKSKNGSMGRKINDGAYETMIQRITSNKNPDFFFMSYSKSESIVSDLLFVPKYFFLPDIIEKRKPLAETARRAGWVGCTILIDKIPKQGRIPIISNGIVSQIDDVVSKVNKIKELEKTEIDARGWLMDVLNCINQISSPIFTLSEVYAYENYLFSKHPNNHNVKPKIRQQLQFLRNKGFIIFLGNGKYQKCE